MEFNGYSQVEIEMLKDEIRKALPGVLAVIPTFAKVTKENYDELIKQGFTSGQAMHMAVLATAKQLGM
ncbi:hypothetical protein DCC39_14490 [Pueribacillus theae]|uniref:Uncharacterized protein n=1 Tax=Pueribacillus theae TaxID=2171751 RepID=A0A2U1JUZ1_9BACI|nr:hypothetical protein [Pueribacillus theae]PWA08643.1 hypothetical protein DCC39_14490 [Pueribacillus theae]